MPYMVESERHVTGYTHGLILKFGSVGSTDPDPTGPDPSMVGSGHLRIRIRIRIRAEHYLRPTVRRTGFPLVSCILLSIQVQGVRRSVVLIT